MIEREFIKERVKYLKVKEYIDAQVGKPAGIGSIDIEKTPLGEKIIVTASRPGIIIGRGGKTISDLTLTLKTKFRMENPQIEVREIENPNLSAGAISKKVASDLERFGPSRFKAIGYRALQDAMRAGALGIEIRIAGRGVPGSRAQAWRFPAGYMKKSGQLSLEAVDFAIAPANLRSGSVGIQVRLMPPTIQMPDKIKIRELPAGQATYQIEAPAEMGGDVPATTQEVKAERPKKSKKKKSAEKVEAQVETKTEDLKTEDQVAVQEATNGNPSA